MPPEFPTSVLNIFVHLFFLLSVFPIASHLSKRYQQKIKVQSPNGFKSLPHITNDCLPALPTVPNHNAPGVASVTDHALFVPSAFNTLPMIYCKTLTPTQYRFLLRCHLIKEDILITPA